MSAPRALVAVIGGSTAEPQVAALARDVGYELGRRGLSLVCGGMQGVMAAACEGLVSAREAHRTGALAVGLLPGTEASDANPFVDLALPTGLGIARNLLIVRAAAAVIAIAGGSGTLSELAFAWQLGRPIVALVPSGGVAATFAGRGVDDRRGDVIMAAATPAQAVELAARSVESATSR